MLESVCVVGANLAGGRAVEALRRCGFTGRIVLVGEELARPYDRPPLSKKFITGKTEESALYLRPEAYYSDQHIEVRLGTKAVALDVAARRVHVATGDAIAFDALIVATGARVRRMACAGAELGGIYYLRTIEDAFRIREHAKTAKRAVVVGAGVIGAEITASLRDLGLDVTVVEPETLPLKRAFGPFIGEILADVHRSRGAELRLCTTVDGFEGSNGHVERVVTTGGDHLPCDLVVVGIGVVPNTDWLEGSGVALERGVLVDSVCMSSTSGIAAVGDVARYFSKREDAYLMIESVDNAQLGAAAAAKTLLGEPTEHDPVPFFWSDQYDLKLQSVGVVGRYDRVVVRGSLEARKFMAFHLRGDKVAFAVGVSRLKELSAAKKIIAAGVRVDDAVLADEAGDLAQFMR